MKRSDKFAHRAVLKKLAEARGDLSLMEEELVIGAAMRRETSDWVPMWIDEGHSVRSDALEATAYRAITDKGVFLWYVCHDRKKKGYHSIAATAVEAFEDAADKWRKRREIKRNWSALKRLQRDLILGRTKVTVTLEDAHKSGLCVLGIEGFMRGVGIAGRTQISGRLAAILMSVEPQVGFPLYHAAAVQGALPSLPSPRATPAQTGSAVAV